MFFDGPPLAIGLAFPPGFRRRGHRSTALGNNNNSERNRTDIIKKSIGIKETPVCMEGVAFVSPDKRISRLYLPKEEDARLMPEK
jgi:hypothetical protein